MKRCLICEVFLFYFGLYYKDFKHRLILNCPVGGHRDILVLIIAASLDVCTCAVCVCPLFLIKDMC